MDAPAEEGGAEAAGAPSAAPAGVAQRPSRARRGGSVDVGFAKLLVAANALVPAVLLGVDASAGELGANPIELVLRASGFLALLLLILTLAVTPARRLLGLPWLGKLRRLLGLLSFAYAAVHVSIYVALDQFFAWGTIASDLITRPFLLAGAGAFAILVALAVTSTDGWVRRLGGKRWARLHRRVYLAGALVVVHYWWAVKADTAKPLLFAGLLVALLVVRVVLPAADRRG